MTGPDPIVRSLRDRVTATDRAVLAALAERIELVAELQRHKLDRGLERSDPDRERWMLDDLRSASAGALSDEGVEELLQFLLGLTRRELGRR